MALVPLLLEAAVRAGTPILLAALGEMLAERAGILNLGVEGMMLVGALAGFIVSQQSGTPWIGVLAAAMAGMMLSAMHAFLSISLHANQVGSGLALMIFGTGLSGLIGKPFVGVPAQGFAPVAVPWLADVPILGRIFFQQDPLVYVAYLLVPGLWVFLYRTWPGLKVRAVGEQPRSADALGISVVAVRYSCVLAGGLAAGLGGAYLSLAYTHMWVDNMTAGRGWIALAHGDLWWVESAGHRFGSLSLRRGAGLATSPAGNWPRRAVLCADDDPVCLHDSGLAHRQHAEGTGALRYPRRFGDGLHPRRVMAT